eukprot:561591-Amphidinium_carterae.1
MVASSSARSWSGDRPGSTQPTTSLATSHLADNCVTVCVYHSRSGDGCLSRTALFHSMPGIRPGIVIQGMSGRDNSDDGDDDDDNDDDDDYDDGDCLRYTTDPDLISFVPPLPAKVQVLSEEASVRWR